MTEATPTSIALVTPQTPDVMQAAKHAQNVVDSANALVIDSAEMYELAGNELNTYRERYRRIEAQRVHLKEPFLEGGRRIDQFFKGPLDNITAACNGLKDRMLAFKQEEDRKAAELRRQEEERARREREEIERQQREAAQRQREIEKREREEREERERKLREADEAAERERKAERDRLAEEARKAEEEGNAAAAEEAAAAQREADERAEAERQRRTEEAAAAQREADARAEAERLESQQAAEEAQAKLDLASIAPAPVVTSAAVTSGISSRKTWKVSSVDKKALVIAAGKAAEAGDETLLSYIDVNETVLNGIAKALKGAARVAGVIFHEVESLAATGRRRG